MTRMSARSGVIGRISGALALATLLPALALAPAPLRAAPAAAPAPADPKFERARELFENGERLYHEGSYEAAILAFKEGYDLTQEPAFLYNIGNCYERIGNFSEARSNLDRYRAFAPEGEREVLSRRISALDERIRKQREDEAAAKPPEGDPPPVKPIEEQPPVTPPADDEPAKKDRVFGPAAIALTGVAVIGLGVGIGLGVKASNDRKVALDGCVESSSGDFLCSAASEDALAARKTSALVADVGFAVAGAAAIGVAVLVGVKAAKKNKGKETARAPRFSPYAGRQGAGLVFQTRF